MQYNDISLEGYAKANQSVTFPNAPLGQNIRLLKQVKLSNMEVPISYNASGNDLANSDTNFESGHWEPIKDCIGLGGGIKWLHDSNGDTTNFVEVAPSSTGKSCISRSFYANLKPNITYKLSFQYKNIRGQKLQFYYNLYSVLQHKNYQYFVSSSVPANGWHNYSYYFTSPTALDELDLFVYASTSQNQDDINLYDNFSLSPYAPVNAPDYFLYSNSNTLETSSQSTDQLISREHNITIKNPSAYFLIRTGTPYRFAALIPGKTKNFYQWIIDIVKSLISPSSSFYTHVRLNSSQNAFVISTSVLCKSSTACTYKGRQVQAISFNVIDLDNIGEFIVVLLTALGTIYYLFRYFIRHDHKVRHIHYVAHK
jgi:hypothetical protein